MAKIVVGSHVKALHTSNTWMNQYDLVGVVTELYLNNGIESAKVSIPKWLIKRNHGGHIIRDWLRNKWVKPEEDNLLLDDGMEIIFLILTDQIPESTVDEKVDMLIDQAFGVEGKRLGINVVYSPKELIVTSGECVCEGCHEPRTHFAWHNCWGTVEAFMVCNKHYLEWNGRCSDGFHLKKELIKS